MDWSPSKIYTAQVLRTQRWMIGLLGFWRFSILGKSNCMTGAIHYGLPITSSKCQTDNGKCWPSSSLVRLSHAKINESVVSIEFHCRGPFFSSSCSNLSQCCQQASVFTPLLWVSVRMWVLTETSDLVIIVHHLNSYWKSAMDILKTPFQREREYRFTRGFLCA